MPVRSSPTRRESLAALAPTTRYSVVATRTARLLSLREGSAYAGWRARSPQNVVACARRKLPLHIPPGAHRFCRWPFERSACECLRMSHTLLPRADAAPAVFRVPQAYGEVPLASSESRRSSAIRGSLRSVALDFASWPFLASVPSVPCSEPDRTASRAPQDDGVVLLARARSRWPAPLDQLPYDAGLLLDARRPMALDHAPRQASCCLRPARSHCGPADRPGVPMLAPASRTDQARQGDTRRPVNCGHPGRTHCSD